MDFITNNALTAGETSAFIIAIIVLSIILVGSIFLGIFGGGGPKADVNFAYFMYLIMTLVSVVALVLVSISFIDKNNGNSYSFDEKKFQSWAADEYMLELDDEQTEALRNNVMEYGDTEPPVPVYVETFNKTGAMAYLFKNDTDWNIVLLQSSVVPTQ